MTFLLLLTLITNNDKKLEVKYTEVPPRIDGQIEEVWYHADSITDFVQSNPDQGAEPTERTVVWVLQDNNNLYIAFRCYGAKYQPVAQLYGLEDEVTVYIDPTGSKSNGYFFRVYASGIYHDGLIMDDGASWNWSWDGVWETKTYVNNDRFETEIKIPFKSIRYQKGVSDWGIDFERMIALCQEHDCWVERKEQEGGFGVSRLGSLTGINPQAQGYYFELYPEGFSRYDQNPGEKAQVKPSASLNFKWDITPMTTLNATVFPDFAQIESDPFTFNLSRYPVYLGELRPFFIEGSEIFRLSDLRNGDFNPLNIFYSRRIGKPVGQEPVPIISGLKLTTHNKDWNFGALGAYTDQLIDTLDSVIEPRRGFGVVSGRRKINRKSNFGFLLSGTMVDQTDHNAALGLEWNYRSGSHQTTIQPAFSEHDGKLGWAFNSGYSGFIGNFASSASFRVIDDSFSVQDIGYVPWSGSKDFEISSGPVFRPKGTILRRLGIRQSIGLYQIPGSDKLSYWTNLSVNPSYRNGWGNSAWCAVGKSYEADTNYVGTYIGFSTWGNGIKYNINFGAEYGYDYNYRQNFLAGHYSTWFSYIYYIAGRVALTLSGNNWWECEPIGNFIGVTSVFRPKVEFRINSLVSFNVYNEIVYLTPETRFRDTELYSNRIGFLFSWNFKPKSWLFVALNDYRVDSDEGLVLADRIAAIKVRYLIYF